jgi:hypothetical protein
VTRHDYTVVGLSSSAMVLAAMTGTDPKWEPFDVYDLNRCERTYERAPEHLRTAMWPILLRFRAKVAEYHAAWHAMPMAEKHRPAAGRDRRDAA